MAKTLVYQIYAPVWPNIQAVINHLYRIAWLGVTHVWLSAALESPWYDHGYDISNHYKIDPRLGSMEEFDELVKTAHRLGMKVLIDLVLNHTSTEHSWFRFHPERYCWSAERRPGWKNLFDGGPAWEYHRGYKQYYLHLFHEKQADLNWFIGGEVNQTLVHEFQKIVKFWTRRHKVDGFRLDVPQAMNKSFTRDNLEFENLLFGDKDEQVINAIFSDHDRTPFLIMECFDPTFGDLVEYYTDQTPVDFVMNVLVKESANDGILHFLRAAKQSEEYQGFMLDTESHDSPRFTSRANSSPQRALWYLLNSQAKAICLYQGQELGLMNPDKHQLSNDELCRWDAQTAMRVASGEDVDALRPLSRANARVPLPLEEYDRQMQRVSSPLKYTRELIARWHRNK